MEDKKIYLDQDGYEDYLSEMEELKEKIKVNSRDKADAGSAANGDGWHDNFDYEQAEREQRKNMILLDEKKANLRNIVLVESHGDKELVDINDYICVTLCGSGNQNRSRIVKLTGALNPKQYGDVHEVTINSPMGSAIYRKKVGETVSYKAKGQVISVVITNKALKVEDLNKKVR